MSLGLSSGGGGGKVSARAATIPGTATGAVYTVSRLLASSALSLISGSNANLSINSTTGAISATAGIGSGLSQTAIVREASSSLAAEYPVVLTGA